jgi:hypothetical protein
MWLLQLDAANVNMQQTCLAQHKHVHADTNLHPAISLGPHYACLLFPISCAPLPWQCCSSTRHTRGMTACAPTTDHAGMRRQTKRTPPPTAQQQQTTIVHANQMHAHSSHAYSQFSGWHPCHWHGHNARSRNATLHTTTNACIPGGTYRMCTICFRPIAVHVKPMPGLHAAAAARTVSATF